MVSRPAAGDKTTTILRWVAHLRRREGCKPRLFRARRSTRFAQERIDVTGKLGVVLEEEPVRRVRIYLDAGLGHEAGEEVGVMGQDHGIAIAVGYEHRPADTAQPLQERVVRDSPVTNSVVLGQSG